MIYHLLLHSIPFIEKASGVFSIILFIFWIYQMKNKYYIASLHKKAIRKYNDVNVQVMMYNATYQANQVKPSSSWLDLYNHYLTRRYNTLLLSIVLGYLSFNTTSFQENNNEDFFKLLTISTTLFLAGVTYIQQRYRE